MTQQDKELLIKDLCARLPYGVKSQNSWIDVNGNEHLDIDKIKWIEEDYIRTDRERKYCSLKRIKPILFPLKAINQEIEVNGHAIQVRKFIEIDSVFPCRITELGEIVTRNTDYLFPSAYSLLIDTFHRYHIDYRNLIGQGLAISVFDLPENPYK